MNRKTILVLAAFIAVACSKKQDKALTIPVEPVKRETIVADAQHIGRGYERFVEKLAGLGADIEEK